MVLASNTTLQQVSGHSEALRYAPQRPTELEPIQITVRSAQQLTSAIECRSTWPSLTHQRAAFRYNNIAASNVPAPGAPTSNV